MQRPYGVNVTTFLMCMSLATDTALLFTTRRQGPAHFDLFDLYVQCLAAVFLWFYWRGHNWARWLVMIQSLVCILSLLGLKKRWEETHLGGTVFVYDALLSVFLLGYLNTKRVRAWFVHK